MRLVDKDVLEDAVQGAINIMESQGISMITASVPLAIIKGAPTIDAIPVDYLKWRIINAKNNGIVEAADAFEFVLKCWKEQEMNNNATD